MFGKAGRATRLLPPPVMATLLGAVALCATAPASRADVATPTSSLTLEWTVPGDDGMTGVAALYDVRYSLEPITPATFAAATRVANIPAPARAGERQRVRIDGLFPDTPYYFGIKTRDESGNWSALSNVVVQTAPDPFKTPLAKRVEMGPPSPSPAREHTLIRLSLPAAAPVHVDVYDAGGRWVRTLIADHLSAGVTPIHWTLGDSGGRPLRSGIYWIRGVFGSEVRTQRLAIVR